MGFTGRQLRSLVTEDAKLTLSLEPLEVGDPGDDEVVVRVEASPINPSDLGLLVGPADLETLSVVDRGVGPALQFDVPSNRLRGVAGRLDQSLPIGTEGAGTVVAAGRNARDLEGKRVGVFGGAMYADYRKVHVDDVLALPEGATAADGASMFVNPPTALGFVETASSGGHKAIVHTAAASNLGQMLQRICLADGIPLVNIVRSQEQVDLLKGIGATHVLNSGSETFTADLADAIAQTGASVAFDALGGGSMGSTILQAMERVAVGRMPEYSRYGSEEFKQLYIYGALDLSPTTLNRGAFGYEYAVSGWLIMSFLRKASPEVRARMRKRVLDELTTTFASNYTRTIGLAEALRPDVLRAYERKVTGEKYLIDPSIG